MQTRRIHNLFLIWRSSFDDGEFDFICRFELREGILNHWSNDRSLSRLQGSLTISINDLRNCLFLDPRNLDRHAEDERRLSRWGPQSSKRKQSKHRSNCEQCDAERQTNRE